MKCLVIAAVLMLALSPNHVEAKCRRPTGDTTPYDIWARLPSAVQDKICDDARLVREHEQREREAVAKEAQRRADEQRAGRVEDARASAERRRAADCATQGSCPSSPKDVRDQLDQSKRN